MGRAADGTTGTQEATASAAGGSRDPRASLLSRLGLGALALALAAYAFVLLRTAWLCDDAYITFRTVDNFVNGYGLRWNVAERVQAFTHPLWMLVLSPLYALTREMYFTPLVLSLAVSLAAALLLGLRVASTRGAAFLAVCILIGS